ncbi:hypothetical protein MACK_004122 [Theileria orientalis]|uniref:Uncharacterized protein n=1 Tax=Theileria orientalis TaxID=68886 RepID=A0A976SJZ1_THEOR|nr:hypothetical protein MACK_004122 [Theileria orientalis]
MNIFRVLGTTLYPLFVYVLLFSRRNLVESTGAGASPIPGSGTKTGVDLSLKKTSGTNEFNYNKAGRVVTYTAKANYGFKSVKTGNKVVWEASNSDEYAIKVVLNGKGKKQKEVTIHLPNNTTKVFKRDGKGKPWTDVSHQSNQSNGQPGSGTPASGTSQPEGAASQSGEGTTGGRRMSSDRDGMRGGGHGGSFDRDGMRGGGHGGSFDRDGIRGGGHGMTGGDGRSHGISSSGRDGTTGGSHGMSYDRDGMTGGGHGMSSDRDGMSGGSHGGSFDRDGIRGGGHGMTGGDGRSHGISSSGRDGTTGGSHGMSYDRDGMTGGGHGMSSDRDGMSGGSHGGSYGTDPNGRGGLERGLSSHGPKDPDEEKEIGGYGPSSSHLAPEASESTDPGVTAQTPGGTSQSRDGSTQVTTPPTNLSGSSTPAPNDGQSSNNLSGGSSATSELKLFKDDGSGNAVEMVEADYEKKVVYCYHTYKFKPGVKCTLVKFGEAEVWKKGDEQVDEPKSVTYNPRTDNVAVFDGKKYVYYNKDDSGNWVHDRTMDASRD